MGTPPKYQAPDADKQKSEKKANAKKPIYKRVWFWVVVIVVLAAIGGNGNKNNTSTTPVASSREAVATTAATSSPATTDSQEPKVDKSKLANAVNQYSSTPSDGWTPESWQVFSDALSKAKTVNESEDAT